MNNDDLRKLIQQKMSTSPSLRSVMKRIQSGKATFRDTAEYSRIFSELVGRYFSENVLSLTDREAVAEELLRGSYGETNSVLGQVQRSIDRKNGLNIRPQTAAFPLERVQQFAHSLVDPTVEDSVIQRRARSGTANISMSFHDDYIRENAQFRNDAGLKCFITRETDGKCCKWCTAIAGRYVYGEEPHDVYRRHDNCGCSVIYENGRQRQDVWSKRTWEAPKVGAGAPPPTKFTPEQARALERERISRYVQSENSKVKAENPITIVENAKINSPKYRQIFNEFSESAQISRIMCQESRNMLKHRTGTEFEDLTFIDSKSGHYITRTDYNVKSQVKPSKRMCQMLRESEPYSIIAIHNHPKSGTPSIDDIGCAYERKYKYGVIACHNGSLYRYSFLGEFDTSEANLSYVDMLLDNVNRIVYNKGDLADSFETKLADALDQLKEKNLKLEVLLWN
ncbi:MAG: hypothetical protein IJ779_08295 [Ruminococcus sp.]|nr:hypothetical protein [Ruminococcus sp.]